MKAPAQRLLCAALLCALTATAAFAQEGAHSVDLPNPMRIHTWFIVGSVGAFLAWCISYAIQLQKEALEKKKDREGLSQRKSELLDKIADLETRKDSGAIADRQYKRELKELRFRLGRILETMSNPETLKSAKKTS